MRPVVVAALLALPLPACGAAERSGAAVVRDSAGIHIVENRVPQWADGEEWRLSEAPLVDIGVFEGDPNYQLDRAFSAARLSDGRIVVLNAGTKELRFYDANGQFLSAAGREGQGPGEFKNPNWLDVFRDSISVFDWSTNRVSVFDASGRFVRSFMPVMPGEGSPISFRGRFGDGSLLVSTGSVFRSGEATTGVARDSMTIFRYDPSGALLDTLGPFPGPEYFVLARGQSMSVASLAFGLSSSLTTRDTLFYFGSTEKFEIGAYSVLGRLVSLIRKEHTRLDVTPADIEQFKQNELENARDPGWRQRIEERFREMPIPRTMPAFRGLFADAEGNLWVGEYLRPSDDTPRWHVFHPEGRLLGRVEMPPNFSVRQIGSDYVLGHYEDELEIEHIRLYRLEKSVSQAGGRAAN